MKTTQLIGILILTVLSLSFVGCSDLIDVNDDKLGEEGNTLKSPNDSVYSLFGVLAEQQKLVERYIILGELRSDLVDVTINSTVFQKEMNEHAGYSLDNPYIDVKPYYSVINNCNYVLAKMDTLVSSKALLTDYAAVLKIRAWTYLELVKNYATVRYSDKPILDISQLSDMSRYPMLSREAVIDLLIPQLMSILKVPAPQRKIGDLQLEKMTPSVEFLLAECYLWSNDFANAAIYYKRMMEKETGYVCTSALGIVYSGASYSLFWNDLTYPTDVSYTNRYEVTYGIYSLAKTGSDNGLNKLFVSEYRLKPSNTIIDRWVAQDINSSDKNLRKGGDRRGVYTSWREISFENTPNVKVPVVFKHYAADSTSAPKRTIIERGATFLLRYAEAINQLGKPSLALTALNSGFRSFYLNDTLLVNPAELADKSYMIDYGNVIYQNSLGVRGRVGLKPIHFPTNLTNLQDSINFVEDVILEEASMECAFEGNRWTDLVRVGLRRHPTNNYYLADIVAQKFKPRTSSYIPFVPTADYQTVRNRLKDKANFFIPFPN